jgi:hypothetical protein
MAKNLLRQTKLILLQLVAVILLIVPLSAPVTASTAAASKLLAAPKNLTIDMINQDDVILLWEEPGDTRITKYIILRTESQGVKPAKIAEVLATESSYTDTTVQIGKSYTYRVQSYAAGLVAGDSELKSVKVVNLSQERFGENGTQSGSNSDSSGSKDSTSLPLIPSVNSDNFWQSIIIFNLLAVAVLVLLYWILRRLLRRRPREKSIDLVLEPKLGKPDVNINKVAKSRYISKRQKLIEEWSEE